MRIERGELSASAARGLFAAATVCDVDKSDGWFWYGTERRVYAPLEHPDLPQRFAAAAGDEDRLHAFVSFYGPLGWDLLNTRFLIGDAEHDEFGLLRQAVADAGGPPVDISADPIAWIEGHAATVQWCLNTAVAIQEKQEPPPLPERLGRGHYLMSRQSALARSNESLFALVGAGGCSPHTALQVVLNENLSRVSRVIVEDDGRLVSGWDAPALLDAIYSLTADAVVSGDLVRCEECRRPLRRQGPGRRRFCPPPPTSVGVESLCSLKKRQREYRQAARTRARLQSPLTARKMPGNV